MVFRCLGCDVKLSQLTSAEVKVGHTTFFSLIHHFNDFVVTQRQLWNSLKYAKCIFFLHIFKHYQMHHFGTSYGKLGHIFQLFCSGKVTKKKERYEREADIFKPFANVYFHEWMFHYSREQHGWKSHQRCKWIWCDHLFPLVKKGGELVAL